MIETTVGYGTIKESFDCEDGIEMLPLFPKRGKNILHDIARLADRVLVLDRGEIAFLGTPDEVFSHPVELREIGLGVPHAQRMANELRELGVPLEEGLYSPETLAEHLVALLESR